MKDSLEARFYFSFYLQVGNFGYKTIIKDFRCGLDIHITLTSNQNSCIDSQHHKIARTSFVLVYLHSIIFVLGLEFYISNNYLSSYYNNYIRYLSFKALFMWLN